MLGAGVGAGAAYTELGLSAKPAAMSHGVTMGAKPTIANQRLVVPTVAAPAGAVESTSQVTDPRHADTSRAPAVSTAQGQQQQQPQEYSTSDAAEADTSRSQAPSKAEINSAAASNIAGKHANQPAEAGRPQRVAPPDQQQSWSQTAWKWFKRIALGEGKDLLELGPPWTKWPGKVSVSAYDLYLMSRSCYIISRRCSSFRGKLDILHLLTPVRDGSDTVHLSSSKLTLSCLLSC